MDAQSSIATDRLLIKPLSITDNNFILELVNTEGWLTFIGNRNISLHEEASAYINRILANNNISYWVVIIKDTQDKIGIVTFIKRDYLKHHDIGFAFLPGFHKQGYAFEATTAVLHHLIRYHNLTHILATTVPGNINSIKLLEKMGLVFEKEIEVGKEKLHVYGTLTNKLML